MLLKFDFFFVLLWNKILLLVSQEVVLQVSLHTWLYLLFDWLNINLGKPTKLSFLSCVFHREQELMALCKFPP